MIPNKRENFQVTDDTPLFESVDPLVGQVVGERWEITASLGLGSMSTVYKAHDLQSGKIVVVKILHRHLSSDTKVLKRFEMQAEAIMQLEHPGIARVDDIRLTADGQVFVVVELLPHESLESLLAKTGHLTADHATDIFAKSCLPLEYAHSVDVLHRDLKPSNILLLETGLVEDVMLVDFGIARLLSDDGEEVKSSGYTTKTKEVFGSPMYMSPEQCTGKKLDVRSDIYSLGCVIYETLTGKPPFVGKNVLETAYKHMHEAPRAIASESSPSRSLERLETIIFKCLAKDPDMRYQLVSQLRSDLKLLNNNEAAWIANAFALKKVARVKRKDKKNISFEAGVFLGGAVLLAVVVVVWGWLFLGSDSGEKAALLKDDELFPIGIHAPQRVIPDIGSQEEALKVNLQTIKHDQGTTNLEYERTISRLVHLYSDAGQYESACQYMNQLIDVAKQIEQMGGAKLRNCYAQQSLLCFATGQLEAAKTNAEQAIDLFDKEGMPNDASILAPLQTLGWLSMKKGDLKSAGGYYDRMYQVAEANKTQGEFSVYVNVCSRLADVYRRQNRLEDAEKLSKQLLDAAHANSSPENLTLEKAIYIYGLVLAQEGKYDQAVIQFKDAIAMDGRRIKKIEQMSKENPLSESSVVSLSSTNSLNKENSALLLAMKRHLGDALWHTNWIDAAKYPFEKQEKQE